MSRLVVMMGVVAVVLSLLVNAVPLCARVGGHHPAGLPAPSPLVLPAWDTQHTHTSYLSCVFYLLMFRVAHCWESLPWGRGRLVPCGGQRRAGNAWGETGVATAPPSLQEQLLPPTVPGSQPPPKRWPLFTVRTRSLCLRFLKYKRSGPRL